jgi:hypothetical protein
MKNLPLVLSLIPLLILAPRAFAAASLAIDANQGSSYGWAINYNSQAIADSYALSQCGSTCSVVMRFAHTCAAYAADQANDSTAYGWAYSPNLANAQNNALSYCQSRGGTNCIVRVYGCDR